MCNQLATSHLLCIFSIAHGIIHSILGNYIRIVRAQALKHTQTYTKKRALQKLTIQPKKNIVLSFMFKAWCTSKMSHCYFIEEKRPLKNVDSWWKLIVLLASRKSCINTRLNIFDWFIILFCMHIHKINEYELRVERWYSSCC